MVSCTQQRKKKSGVIVGVKDSAVQILNRVGSDTDDFLTLASYFPVPAVEHFRWWAVRILVLCRHACS
jgi:hypothetical protein